MPSDMTSDRIQVTLSSMVPNCQKPVLCLFPTKKMATIFLSTAKTFLPALLSSSSSSSSSSPASPSTLLQKHSSARPISTLCKPASSDARPPYPPILARRSLSISLTAAFLSTLAGGHGGSAANAAILEADDDEELLERVKKDRKRRLDRQGVISSSNKETAYLQDLVYKLNKVGQAIEKNDLPAASSVLGKSTDADWVRKANAAFTKLSSSPEEKTEVDAFNTSLTSLISSVIGNDVEASKIAFVSSATAFEKWSALTGLVDQLKGL